MAAAAAENKATPCWVVVIIGNGDDDHVSILRACATERIAKHFAKSWAEAKLVNLNAKRRPLEQKCKLIETRQSFVVDIPLRDEDRNIVWPRPTTKISYCWQQTFFVSE